MIPGDARGLSLQPPSCPPCPWPGGRGEAGRGPSGPPGALCGPEKKPPLWDGTGVRSTPWLAGVRWSVRTGVRDMGTDLPSFETTVQGRERLILAPNLGAWSLIVLHFSPKQPWRETPPPSRVWGPRQASRTYPELSGTTGRVLKLPGGASLWLGAVSRPLSPHGGVPLPHPGGPPAGRPSL